VADDVLAAIDRVIYRIDEHEVIVDVIKISNRGGTYG
jgi:mRNA-degrading endonuclease RelE of RelBE toxin-antitoxin system